jgi:hypothetical protein
MLISNFQSSLGKISSNFSVNNVSEFFHTWIKRNCFQVDNTIYELDLDNLLYLSILLYELEKLNEIYNYIDINTFKKDISLKYQNDTDSCKTFEQQMYIEEKYQRIYFVIDEYLSILKSESEPIVYSIQKINNIIFSLNKYAEKQKTNTIYYNFSYE